MGCAAGGRYLNPSSDEVTLVTTGDGATSEGEFWEMMNVICLDKLPVLVLDRSKPEEAVLVRLLLNTGEELAEAKGPILFAIYGKGRALPGLAGEDLSEKYLFEVTSFLCGPCSCTIKAFNP